MKSHIRQFIEGWIESFYQDEAESELTEAIEKDNTMKQELPHKESQPEVTNPLLRENKDGSFSLTDEATKILNETFEKGLRKESQREADTEKYSSAPGLQQQINYLAKRVEELEGKGEGKCDVKDSAGERDFEIDVLLQWIRYRELGDDIDRQMIAFIKDHKFEEASEARDRKYANTDTLMKLWESVKEIDKKYTIQSHE